jgi:WD40 repeat protein
MKEHGVFGKELATIDAGTPIMTMAWSPDGRHLATQDGIGNHVALWDAQSWRKLWSVQKSGVSAQRRVLFTPDGRFVLTDGLLPNYTFSTHPVMVVIDAHSGEIARHLTTEPPKPSEPSNAANDFALSGPADLLVAVTVSRHVVAYRLSDWSPRWTVASIEAENGRAAVLECVAVSPDGKSVVVGTLDGLVVILDGRDGRELRRIKASPLEVQAMAFNPRSGELVTAGSGAVETRYSNGPDGARKATTLQEDPARLHHAWDVETGEKVRDYSGPFSASNSLGFPTDGTLLFAVKQPGALIAWQADTGKVVGLVPAQAFPHAIAVAPDGTKAIYSSGNKMTLLSISK